MGLMAAMRPQASSPHPYATIHALLCSLFYFLARRSHPSAMHYPLVVVLIRLVCAQNRPSRSVVACACGMVTADSLKLLHKLFIQIQVRVCHASLTRCSNLVPGCSDERPYAVTAKYARAAAAILPRPQTVDRNSLMDREEGSRNWGDPPPLHIH
jgi:hypothetical protein